MRTQKARLLVAAASPALPAAAAAAAAAPEQGLIRAVPAARARQRQPARARHLCAPVEAQQGDRENARLQGRGRGQAHPEAQDAQLGAEA